MLDVVESDRLMVRAGAWTFTQRVLALQTTDTN